MRLLLALICSSLACTEDPGPLTPDPVDAGTQETMDGSMPDPYCGDGRIDPRETCDDGDGNSDTVPGACRTSCLPAGCDDGVVDPGELCIGRTFLIHPGEVRFPGDQNQDGTLDFVTRSNGRFELLLSDGPDQWSSVWSDEVPAEPLFWRVDLLDGDDLVDLVLVEGNGVHTWLGTNDGFTAARVDTSSVSAVHLLHPFSDDPFPDLLVETAGGLAMLRNDGSGRFTTSGTISLTGARLGGFSDVDGDGLTDILLDDGTTAWNRVSAEGTFGPRETIYGDPIYLSLEIDGTIGQEFITLEPPGFTMTFLDYDGSMLVPIAGPTTIPGLHGLWDADGDGLYEAAYVADGELSIYDLPSGQLLDARPGKGLPRPSDFDDDGVPEVTLVNGVEYQVFEQTSERLLGDPERYSLDVPAAVYVPDGMGAPARFFSGAGGVGLARGLHMASAVVNREVDPQQIELLDLNDDGIDDVVMATSRRDLVVGWGDGLGGYELTAPQLDNDVERFAMADLNGDDRPDLINAKAYQVRLALQTSAGLFEHELTRPIESHQVEDLALGDHDGDGLLDVTVASGLSANISTLYGQPGPDLSDAQTYRIQAHAVDMAQIDGQPGEELLLVNRVEGTLTVRHYGGLENEVETAPDPRDVIAADLDGDGLPEVIVATRTSVQIFDRDLNLVTEVEVLGAYHLVAGDLDGDGDTDLLTAAPMGEATMLTDPNDYGLATALLNDGGTFTPAQPFFTRGPPRSIGLTDANGDGALDLVAATHGTPTFTRYTPWEPALVTYLARP